MFVRNQSTLEQYFIQLLKLTSLTPDIASNYPQIGAYNTLEIDFNNLDTELFNLYKYIIFLSGTH